MPSAKPTTVKAYLASLPAERREALQAVREVILKNLPKGYEEGMQYGMIGYYVPHTLYPEGYHCDPKQPVPFAGLGSQKNHMSLYMCSTYMIEGEGERFRAEWVKGGRKLDMGKGCVRFKSIDDVPLPVVGRAIKRMSVRKFLEHYEANLPATALKKRAAAKKKAVSSTKVTKAPARKIAKKAASKRAPARKAGASKKGGSPGATRSRA